MPATAALVPVLPRAVWRLEAAGLIDTFGSGLVLPFVVLYLHAALGLGYGVAGALLALQGATGLAAGPVAGILIDRAGARATLVGSLAIGAAGYLLLAAAGDVAGVAVACVALGIGSAGFWPAHGALLAALAPGPASHRAFAVSGLARNAGIGLGAAVGGLLVSVAHPESFRLLLVVDAGTNVLAAALVLGVGGVAGACRECAREAGGFRAALRDRGLVVAIAVNAAMIGSTVAAFDFVGPFLHATAGVDESAIGVIWAVNTAAVVVLQLPAARLAGGRRRMRGTALASALWAVGLLGFGLAGVVADGLAVPVALAGAVVFAVGECLYTPLQASLVGELAPSALAGRYQALQSMSWDVGGLAGPVLAGIVFAATTGGLWPVLAAAVLATGGGALAAERALPERTRVAPPWR